MKIHYIPLFENKTTYKYGENEKLLKEFYNDIIDTLPKEFQDKKIIKIKVESTINGVFLQIDNINWNRPYKHYMGYKDAKNNQHKEFVKDVIIAEIESL